MRQLTQYKSSPLSAPWADRLGAEARQVSVHGQQHARPTAHPHESPTYHGLRQRRVRHDERTGSDAPDQQRQRQQQEHNSRVCCTVGGSKGGLLGKRGRPSPASLRQPSSHLWSLGAPAARGTDQTHPQGSASWLWLHGWLGEASLSLALAATPVRLGSGRRGGRDPGLVWLLARDFRNTAVPIFKFIRGHKISTQGVYLYS